MISGKDPQKYIGTLQECLRTDKKPLGILLGAGCPKAVLVGGKPLIPDIAGLTEMIKVYLEKENKECFSSWKIIEGHFTSDAREDKNIETILGHIRSLHSVAGKAEVRDLSAEKLEKLDDAICQAINVMVDEKLPENNTPYHDLADWINSTNRMSPVEIFTTNYDLLMEQAFEMKRVPYFEGFPGSNRPYFDIRAIEEDLLPLRWARFWKLHGSINWYKNESAVFRGTTTEKNQKRVIHPSHLKYEESRRMPYLAMLDRLKTFLKNQTASFITCGYSFNDEHINEIILQGLQGNNSRIVFALLFDPLENYKKAITLASKCSNLLLLARDGGVIGGNKYNWLKVDGDSQLPDIGKWVEWKPVDEKKPDGVKKMEFLLGNFKKLGALLTELAGSTSLTSVKPNGE